jgi:hypothetical protein
MEISASLLALEKVLCLEKMLTASTGLLPLANIQFAFLHILEAPFGTFPAEFAAGLVAPSVVL